MNITDQSLTNVIAQKSSGTVAIFDKGDYYVCYGNDALFMAAEIFRSDICLKKCILSDTTTSIAYVVLNNGQYQRVVRDLLLILHYRVELYSVGDEQRWEITAKGTVGNVGDFEDIVGELGGASNVMGVRLIDVEQNTLSVCFWNSSDLQITCAELVDNKSFAQLEQCVIGMSPRECVVFGYAKESAVVTERRKKLSGLLKRVQVLETFNRLSEDRMEENWENVEKVVKTEKLKSALSENTKSVLCGLFNYLKLGEQEGLEKKMSLVDYRTTGFMHIDGAAVRALELFNLNFYQETASAGGTLFSVLNKCKTAGGQRLLREWIARPLSDVRLITDRLDAVSAFLDCDNERKKMSSVLLPRVPDISQLSRKLLQKKAKLQDCYRVYQLVVLLRQFEHVMRDVHDSNEKIAPAVKEIMLEPLCFAMSCFERFEQLIRATVDAEYHDKTGNFRVKPSIDPQLQQIANEMEELEDQAEGARRKMAAKLDMSSLKMETNSQYGFFFKVTLHEEKNIRKAIGVRVLDTNKGGGCKFSTDTLDDISQRFRDLHNVYEDAQANLERQVVETSASFAQSLSALSQCLSTMDVLCSLATVAAQSASGYCRPVLHPMGSGIFELRKGRHAILEQITTSPFIPNDLCFGDKRLVVVTGANMGGKSTYLRSAALCTLLAQIGSFVPADSFELSVVDGIFTRVGASDQQTRGISTFMAEMIDCASILENATKNSLIIVDELGRGTSTFDGFGLAWAIAKDILDRVRGFCVFATHFHEMVAIADDPAAINMQTVVQADEKGLSMLYEVREGVAKSSYGIHVAKILRFPQNVIEDASSILKTLEHDDSNCDDVVSRLKTADDDQLREMLLAL